VTDDHREAFLFLYGADMDPTAVRAALPAARFVARAWVPTTASALPPLPAVEPPPPLPGAARSPDTAVWGILLRVPEPVGAPAAEAAAEATTDDERRVAATIATPASALADRAAVLAAARYWELPPGYVRRLAVWAEGPA
jgi:hypothetical protein